MALFGKKEKPAKAEAKKVAVKETSSEQAAPVLSAAPVIVRPHITEKAAILTDENVYVFEVTKDATKHSIKREVARLYKKTPEKVAITRNAGKTVMRRKGRGQKPGIKKAYVYMKEGDSLDIL